MNHLTEGLARRSSSRLKAQFCRQMPGRPRLPGDFLHDRDGTLADERNGHRVGAHDRLTITPMKGER